MNKTQAAMTDLLFFLLLVFMSYAMNPKSHQTQAEQPAIEIEAANNDMKEVPKNKEGDEIPRILVSISAQGIYTVNGKVVSVEQIKTKALSKEISTVRLKIASSTPYEIIQVISRALNKSGLSLELM